MNIERPGSPSATTVAPTSKRRSTSIEIRRSRLASERPPKKGVATKNAFRSGELTAISRIYSRSRNLTAPYRLPGIQEDLSSTTRMVRCICSRPVVEGKRTCHGDRESDDHDPAADFEPWPFRPVSSGRRCSAISYQASPSHLCTTVDRRYHCLRRTQKRPMTEVVLLTIFSLSFGDWTIQSPAR